MRQEKENPDIEKAVEILKNGGLILYPTDTVWGIGCDATNDKAIKRIFRTKQRSDSKAMISLVDSLESLKKCLYILPPKALEALSSIKNPLTIIFDSPKNISPLLKSSDGSAAFRIVKNDFTAELCRRLGAPIVSTSANISGTSPAATFHDITDEISSQVDYICKTGRDMPAATPSRILKISNDGIIIPIR